MRLAIAAVAALVLVACGRHAPSGVTTTQASPTPSAVPEPEGLVASMVIRGPDALLQRVERGIGGTLGKLPETTGGALVAADHLDVALAGEIDGAEPAYAAAAGPSQSLAWVAALRLHDFDHAKATLLSGPAPAFTSTPAEDGMLLLRARRNDAETEARPVLALSPFGFVLVASTTTALSTLAPYVTRTLPRAPPSTHAVTASLTHTAFAGFVHDRLDAWIRHLEAAGLALDASQRAAHGGRAPDYGDPRAVVTALDVRAREWLAAIADLASGSVTADAGDGDVTVEATFTRGTGPSADAIATLAVGNAAPLLTLSSDTQAGLLLRDDPAALKASAVATADQAAQVFKPALPTKDVARFRRAVEGWGEARGPWLTLGLEVAGTPALTIRTPAADADRAPKAVGDLVSLADVPAFREILKARLGIEDVSTATAAAAGSGTSSIATFRRKSGDSEAGVAWALTGDLLRVGVATSPARALQATHDPAMLLGTDPDLAGKLGALQSRARLVVFGRRAPEGGRRPSIVLGVGRDRNNGWALVDADDEILREAVAQWLDP